MERQRHNVLAARSLGLLLVPVLVLGTAACDRPGLDEGTNPRGDVVVARVDGEAITTADLDAVIGSLADQEERLEFTSPEPVQELVEGLIDQKLMAGEARRRGLDKDPAVAARLADLPAGTPAVLRDRVLAQAYLNVRVAAAGEPDAAAVRAWYDNHGDEFLVPERVRVRRIVYGEEAAARQARTDLATGLAFEALLERDRASARVDEVWLQAPPRDQGPPPPLEALAFALNPGDFSDVLALGNSFLLLRVEERLSAVRRPFAEVEAGIRARLAEENGRKIQAAEQARLRERARIERTKKQDSYRYRFHGQTPPLLPSAQAIGWGTEGG